MRGVVLNIVTDFSNFDKFLKNEIGSRSCYSFRTNYFVIIIVRNATEKSFKTTNE